MLNFLFLQQNANVKQNHEPRQTICLDSKDLVYDLIRIINETVNSQFLTSRNLILEIREQCSNSELQKIILNWLLHESSEYANLVHYYMPSILHTAIGQKSNMCGITDRWTIRGNALPLTELQSQKGTLAYDVTNKEPQDK